MANEPVNKPAAPAPAGQKPADPGTGKPEQVTPQPEVQSTAVGGFGKTVTTNKNPKQPTSEEAGSTSTAEMPVGGNAPALDQRDQATAVLPGDQGLANKPGMSAH